MVASAPIPERAGRGARPPQTRTDSEPEKTTPAPFNADALRAQIDSSVRGAVTDLAQRHAQEQAKAQQYQAAQQQQAGDPIYNQVVRPYVEPIARAVATQSEAALDAVKFYNRHPEAHRYTNAIEENFDRLLQAGKAFDRESVWNHYKGANQDHFFKEQQEAATRAAAQGAAVGASGVGRPDTAAFDMETFKKLPVEEMEKVLAGHTF